MALSFSSMRIFTAAFFIFAAVVISVPMRRTRLEGHIPEQIHVSFSGDASAYVIQWVSFGSLQSTDASLVEYGASPSSLDLVSRATPWNFVELRCNTSRIMHSVVISRVTPGNSVFFRVSMQGYDWSPILELHAPTTDASTGVTFSIFGDMGSRFTKTSVGKLILDTKGRVHDFVIHHGDIAYNIDDNCNRVGDDFMNAIQEIATGVPYMFGPGNHESDVDKTYISYINRYKGQEVVGTKSGSGSSRYYSWDMPNVHFLMLDTDAWIYPTVTAELLEPMYEFARRDLASVDRSKTPWVIAIGHRAMYCSYESYTECVYEASNIRYGIPTREGRKFGLEPLLKEFGVDLYVAGHTHHYERSYPVLQEVPVQKDYINPQAPVHLLIGRGGVDSIDHFADATPVWAAFRDMSYTIGYGRIHIHNSTHLDFVQLDGTKNEDVAIDSISIVQRNHGPF